mgnify:CR=1 FL=1
MGGFADKHRQKEKETKEAVENKVKEYGKLTEEITELKKSNGELKSEIEGLKGTISSLTEALQEITSEKIESVQKAGVQIFEPLKQTADELNKEIKSAGKEAADRVRNAGKKTWQEFILQGAVTAVWYVMITFAVMWWGMGFDEIKTKIDYIVSKASVIHYNQTTGQEYGTYDPWHMSEYHDKLQEMNKQSE